uniref:Uncharacterized protein n=1 Tax=Glossina palpalis gambiensis TaxID=67801 RepID=A0A1B0B0S2_9MUSC
MKLKDLVYKKQLCDEFLIHSFNILQVFKIFENFENEEISCNFSADDVERVETVDIPSYEKRESPEDLLEAVKLLFNLEESKNESLERLKQILKANKSANGTGSSTSTLSSPISATSSLVSSLPTGKLTFKQFLEILEKLNIYPVHEEVIQLIESNSDRINKLYEVLKKEMNDDDCGDDIFECLWDLFN